MYTIDGVLIYQDNIGGSNQDKKPVGGVITSSIIATSMMETIKNPIIFYYADGIIISQVGHTKALWDYYWTSYSRGVDGKSEWPYGYPKRHNEYLNGYNLQRSKSIYDPCPYGFRVPSNGTYNQFKSYPSWVRNSYSAGVYWDLSQICKTWIQGLGFRNPGNAIYTYVGGHGCFHTSTISNTYSNYCFLIGLDVGLILNYSTYSRSQGNSVRCIEDCERRLSSQHLPCDTTAKALYKFVDGRRLRALYILEYEV